MRKLGPKGQTFPNITRQRTEAVSFIRIELWCPGLLLSSSSGVHVCACGICTGVCACRCAHGSQRRTSSVPQPFPLEAGPLLEPIVCVFLLGWQLSPSDPPVSAPTILRLQVLMRLPLAVYVGSRIQTQVLMVVQQVLLMSDPSLRFLQPIS